MKRTAFLPLVLLFGLMLVGDFDQLGVGQARAAEEAEESDEAAAEEQEEIPQEKPEGMSEKEWAKMKAKRLKAFDKGPSTIDVSEYPAEMQTVYESQFKKACSQCHTISRAINAPYALPEEWKAYIQTMMKKPSSGITPKMARSVYDFLVYDSEVRKQEMIEQKLKEKEELEKEEPETTEESE